MELKLNIYIDEELSGIEKTYTRQDFELSTAVAEDILDLINIDMFTGELSETQQFAQLAQLVVKGKAAFKDLVKKVFKGVTEDELRRTSLKEFVRVVYNIIVYTIAGLTSVADQKN